MGEIDSVGSRAEFLGRVQRFTDMMLDRFSEASKGKDVDGNEIRMLGNMVVKSLKIWEKAFPGQNDSRLEEKLRQAKKQVSETKS